MPEVLSVLVLIGSGTAAGVLFSVALSVVPAFAALSPERYVEFHKLVGRRFDRVMPATLVTAIVADAVLAATGSAATPRTLFAIAAALELGVSLVSQFGNVPINRRVKSLPTGPVPSGWIDTRAKWRALNLLRTYFAVLALGLNACAVVLAR